VFLNEAKVYMHLMICVTGTWHITNWIIIIIIMLSMQITGNYQWARDQVATMQQACVDDVLMGNYSDVNDSGDLNALITNGVNDVVSHRCEPYDCNQQGRCDNGLCVCSPGMSISLSLSSSSSSSSSLWSLSSLS